MKRTVLAGLILAVAMTGTFGAAGAAPPTWSLDRASISVSAQGAIIDRDEDQTSHFLPGISLAYSLSENLVVGGVFEREFPDKLSLFRGAARWKVFDNGLGAVSLGANLLSYGDEGAAGIVEPTSWSACVNGQWAAMRTQSGRTLAWAIASVEYDPENTITFYRLGLRYQLIGGRPDVQGPDSP